MTTSSLKAKRYIKSRADKTGKAPGSLIRIGGKSTIPVTINLIDFNETFFEEKPLNSIKDGLNFKENKKTVSWIDVEGVSDSSIIEAVGEFFDSNYLILEDMLNTDQRPKIEFHDGYIFMVLKMLSYNENTSQIDVEQVSIIFGSHYVISLQEGKEGDVFDPVRDRIRKGTPIRKRTTDYLAYCLVDVIIDNYFIILEKIADKMENIEARLLNNPTSEVLQDIYELKREVIFLRKTIWPMRELLAKFERSDSELICNTTHEYIRDAYDHIIQIIDNEETFRDMITGMMDLYLSMVNNKMNEVMKLLSLTGSIFIPLTFIAGVYGMNFHYMPELEWHYGYHSVWFLMISIAVLMITIFKKKKWL